MFELLSQSEHTATRKEHICCECGTKIFLGQRYNSTRALWESDFNVSVSHADCLSSAQSSELYEVLEFDYSARSFVIEGMSEDSDCAEDVIRTCLDCKFDALLTRLRTHDWIEKIYQEKFASQTKAVKS